MNIKSSDFRVREGMEVDLKEWPTRVNPVYATKEEYQELLQKHVKALSAQQELLYASDRYAVLLIFQAMDAAGKDGAILARARTHRHFQSVLLRGGADRPGAPGDSARRRTAGQGEG
jgi:polyphosphate kinase 2 (PPK2 family)